MIKIRKDAPMRKRAVEMLKARGQSKLAKKLANAKTMNEVLRILNEAH